MGILGAGTSLWITLADSLESLRVLEPLFLSGLRPFRSALFYAGAGLLVFLLLILVAVFVVWVESSRPN